MLRVMQIILLGELYGLVFYYTTHNYKLIFKIVNYGCFVLVYVLIIYDDHDICPNCFFPSRDIIPHKSSLLHRVSLNVFIIPNRLTLIKYAHQYHAEL